MHRFIRITVCSFDFNMVPFRIFCRMKCAPDNRANGSAEHQNRIILHDNTLNLPVAARQPHPDPNYAPHTAARRVAGASRTGLGVS